MTLLLRHHPEKPVERPGGLCACRDCPRFALTVRITEGGYAVKYCARHERQAARLFDREWRLDGQ